MLVVAGAVTFVLLMWYSPSVPITLLGGFALALAISFPVRALSRFMPRGLAILALVILVPILITQLLSFIRTVPGYATDAEQLLEDLLEPLSERGLLPGTPEEFMSNLGQDLTNLAQSVAQQILSGLLGFISGTFGLVLPARKR